MEEMALEFTNVSTKGRKFSLQNISFSLPKGYIMGLAGKNGAGKTTLLQTIINESAKYTGSIKINGRDIRDSCAYMNKVAWISEENVFVADKSGMENAKLLSVFFENFDMDIFIQKMNDFNVSIHRSVAAYSKGEFVKFQLAFGIAHGAEIFIMDEATAGMDVVFRKEFWKQVGNWIATENITVILATHIEQELEIKADYVGIMEEGRMTSYGENEAI